MDRKREAGVEVSYCASLDELLKKFDCVVLACPYTTAIHHILSTGQFRLAKEDGMRIVDIARGRLIDEAALLEAVQDGLVVGVGLDVHADLGLRRLKMIIWLRYCLIKGVCSRTSGEEFDKSRGRMRSHSSILGSQQRP